MPNDEINYGHERQDSQGGMVKIKTLIAEDDPITRLLYDNGLFEQIFDKKIVISGKEAMRVYELWQPDIIILDIYLPEMTGFQVLKDIRTKIKDKKTTIVVATALYGKEDVISCMKLGVDGYIIKPLPLREIGLRILGYYAKKEPERGLKAEALCRELIKAKTQVLLDEERAKAREETEGLSVSPPGGETGAAGGDEANEGPAEKPKP